MLSTPTIAALVDLNGAPRSVGWGWLQISVGNLTTLMVLGAIIAVALTGRQSDV